MDAGRAARSAYFRVFARLGRGWRDDSGVVRAVDGFADAHFVDVVRELFAAVQANDVALAVRLACLGDRRNRTGQAAVGTAKQQIQHVSIIGPP